MKRKLFSILLIILLLFSFPGLAEDVETDTAAETLLMGMSREEKVAQLFFVRLEDISRLDKVTKISGKLKRALVKFPVGGIVYFGQNIRSETQITKLNLGIRESCLVSGIIPPFLGVDEEGGSVARVADALHYSKKSAESIGLSENAREALETADTIGEYLNKLGFTLDFAPVADVRTDVKNAEIRTRSFGYDPAAVGGMTAQFVQGLQKEQVISVLKHFPGHGAVSGNSHNQQGISQKTVDEWRESDWIPFRQGLEAGARMIMISHQTAVNVDPENPASLSRRIVTELLRGELGFDGVVITDALRMKAVSESFGSGEACVRAIEAGCDMLLLPKNFTNGYNGVLTAVKNGRISEERLNESVLRILKLKLRFGIIQ